MARSTLFITIFVASGHLAACGGGSVTAPSAGDSATRRVTTTDLLEIREIRVFANETLGCILHADGRLETALTAGGMGAFGSIHSDGSFVWNDGRAMARLAADGTIRTASGELLAFTLHPDGTLTDSRMQAVYTITSDGTLSGREGAERFRFEGVDSLGSRRTAMFLFAILGSPAVHTLMGGSRPPP